MITVRILRRPTYPQFGCTNSPGDVVLVTDTLGQRWVSAGVAELVEESKAELAPPVHKMVTLGEVAVKRGPGRPRKER